ncbi:MAG: hypothetical protein OXF31_12605 [Gammaproteobacteria bacterium]|nr:hypothetical protein [Gammaproteobacteria bacterium]
MHLPYNHRVIEKVTSMANLTGEEILKRSRENQEWRCLLPQAEGERQRILEEKYEILDGEIIGPKISPYSEALMMGVDWFDRDCDPCAHADEMCEEMIDLDTSKLEMPTDFSR